MPDPQTAPAPLFDAGRPYFLFNREERHLAGVLFHLLCLGDNADRLCSRLCPNWPVRKEEFGVYLEYSYFRDAWDEIGRRVPDPNARKREILLVMLAAFGGRPELVAALALSTGVEEFNRRFVRHRPSKTDIQSPATWQVGTFGIEGSGFTPEDLLALCKLKWAFRAKPDVVVQPSLGRAICLELKLESGKASYPATGAEIRLLRERGLYDEGSAERRLPMRQTKLQRLAMEHLFGAGNVALVFITRDGPRGEEREHLSWRSLIEMLEIPTGLPQFAQAAIDRCCPLNKEAPPPREKPMRARRRRTTVASPPASKPRPRLAGTA
ncbi:hypothetical protein EAH89_10460 [Roseomonas nepalensis]|uniref:Uncharacterized protein n=1 Tax=Muricoccus nepalensis TaxID=1854500 RepID=A0A502G7I4_9PROT|nr:hypothetical protein [Roseomonas nepalensis]TPG57829.1 hypothetical protein EAH89_10460 [Roseomonas nepalensis]